MGTEDLYRFGVAGFVLVFPIALLFAVAGQLSPGVVAAGVFFSLVVGFVVHQVHYSYYLWRTSGAQKRPSIDFITDSQPRAQAFRRWQLWFYSAAVTDPERSRSLRLELLYHSFASIAWASVAMLVVVVVALIFVVFGFLRLPDQIPGLLILIVLCLLMSVLFHQRRKNLLTLFDQFDEHLVRRATPSALGVVPRDKCDLCGAPLEPTVIEETSSQPANPPKHLERPVDKGRRPMSALLQELTYPEHIRIKLSTGKESELSASDKKKKSDIDALNSALRKNSIRIAEFDPQAGRWRLGVLVVLALVTTIASIGFLVAVAGSKDLGTILSSAAVVIAGLLVAGFMNPLQTIERDVIFRRWSDMVIHAFLLQAADENLKASQLKGVADSASAQFAALSAAYAAVANKSLETLQIVAKPGDTKDQQSEDRAGQSLSVTNPGIQASKKDVELTPPLQIQAKGGEKLDYSSTGLPAGLKLDGTTGKITGKPTTVETQDVTVSVTDVKARVETKVEFTWTIT